MAKIAMKNKVLPPDMRYMREKRSRWRVLAQHFDSSRALFKEHEAFQPPTNHLNLTFVQFVAWGFEPLVLVEGPQTGNPCRADQPSGEFGTFGAAAGVDVVQLSEDNAACIQKKHARSVYTHIPPVESETGVSHATPGTCQGGEKERPGGF